jgi:hypothetical protein
MPVCPHCFNGDPVRKPGSSASGLFCLGCGQKLIPDKPTATQVIAADATQISAADTALATMQRTLATVVVARKKLEADLSDSAAHLNAAIARTNAVTAERDALQNELDGIRSALAHAGMPVPPVAPPVTVTHAPVATAQTAAPVVDFHGVPIPSK